MDDAAKPVARKGFGIGNDYARFTGRMQTLFLWRNDSDFDRTPPFYNANDQDVGVVGTFAPMLEVTCKTAEDDSRPNLGSTSGPPTTQTTTIPATPTGLGWHFAKPSSRATLDKQRLASGLVMKGF